MTERVQFKQQLLKNLQTQLPVEFEDSAEVICISVLGLNIELRFQGPYAKSNLEFCQKYYTLFESSSSSPQYKIVYRTDQGELADPLNWTWSDPDPYSIDGKMGLYSTVIERDFISLFHNDQNVHYVQGPRLDSGATDVLDNLITKILLPDLVLKNTILLHSVAMEFQGKAYVFFGPSGVGKSTLGQLFYGR